ncbi:hypothetical protein LINPERPRIM_LOCUS23477 [Linum perenne]
MLLLMITIAAVTGKQSCGTSGPSSDDVPCKYDYATCVTNVITDLQDNTLHNSKHHLTTSFPHGNPSGGVKGEASCDSSSNGVDCQSCLNGAKGWLERCTTASSGHYSYGHCTMSFHQIS